MVESKELARQSLVVAVVVLVLLYSIVIATRPLFGVSMVAWLFLLYLAWRFVRAVERIADALEARE